MKYQAGIGASLNKVHIYCHDGQPFFERDRLSLCRSTNVLSDYRGALRFDKWCGRCQRALADKIEGQVLTAELIGVAELIPC